MDNGTLLYPRLSSNDTADVCLGDVEPGSQGYLCFAVSMCLANLTHLFPGQMDVVTTARPPSLCPVAHVVLVCSNSQVRRIAARWVVAGMKDVHAFWHWLVVGEFPRYAMGEQLPAIIHNGSMPEGVLSSLPFPALVGATNIYAVPKTIEKWYVGIMRIILHSAEALRRSWPSPRAFERRWDNFMCGPNYSMESLNA